jgi:hypothetical protein
MFDAVAAGNPAGVMSFIHPEIEVSEPLLWPMAAFIAARTHSAIMSWERS